MSAIKTVFMSPILPLRTYEAVATHSEGRGTNDEGGCETVSEFSDPGAMNP